MKDDAKVIVYIAAHKAFRKPEAPYLCTLQTGPLGTPPLENAVSHESGDSIARWSENMCELTALYWVWKNTLHPYTGLCHYRRYFGEPGGTSRELLSARTLERLIESGRTMIVAKKCSYWPFSIAQHYAFSHSKKDLEAVRSILLEEFRDYGPTFDQMMAGHQVHLYNMFIASRPVMDEYCRWLFRIFDVAIERGLHVGKVGREKRIYGFLSERLLNVWVAKNLSSVALYECPVVETEPRSSYARSVDVARRIGSFYARRIFAPERQA